MAKVSDWKLLRDQTWAALETFDLDIEDRMNVVTYERLLKMLALCDKQLMKTNQPEKRRNPLEIFLNSANTD